MAWSDKPKSYYDEKYIELNVKYAVILLEDRCLVLNKSKDPDTGRANISFSSPTDFHHFYANKRVSNPNPKAREEMISVSNLWWLSKQREEYRGIVFKPGQEVPGYYNLYQGLLI